MFLNKEKLYTFVTTCIYFIRKNAVGLISIVAVVIAGTLLFNYLKPNSAKDNKEVAELSVEEKHWKQVFDNAFEKVDCPEPRDPETLPDGYYKGPMIDTHIHIQSLPDGAPGLPLESYSGENIGTKLSIDKWVCMIDVEGTDKVLAFFPVWEPIIEESIDLVTKTLEKYPDRFIPFIMPPDNDQAGTPTVNAAELEEKLGISPDLFTGYGEIGLYSNEQFGGHPALSPDSQRLTEIYPVIRENNLLVYFHLGYGHREAIERAAAANRDITFIFHGGQLYDVSEDQVGVSHDERILASIEEILYNNPNVYFGVDELYGGEWMLEQGRAKEEFLDNLSDYEPLFEKDLSLWEGFIERHPDQVLWGTDRGVSATWDKDPDIAVALNNYIRSFIGKLDPAVQEKFAYKNAEKLFSAQE